MVAIVSDASPGLSTTSAQWSRLYGPGRYRMDGLWNLQVGRIGGTDRRVAWSFIAEASGQVNLLRGYLADGSSGYADGDGGTVTATVYEHDAAKDRPDETAPLASGSLVVGLSGGSHSANNYATPIPMTPTGSLVAGRQYWIVWGNTDTSGGNYVSMNHFHTLAANGWPSRWGARTNYRVFALARPAGGGAWTWTERTPWCPVIEVYLSSGERFGAVQIESGAVDDDSQRRVFTLTSGFLGRERWTPKATVARSAFSFFGAASVSGSMQIRFRQGSTVLATLTATQASANYSRLSLDGRYYASGVWYDLTFDTPVTFVAGAEYVIEFLPQGGSQWKLSTTGNGGGSGGARVFPLAFSEGGSEVGDGVLWHPTYHWGDPSAVGAFGAENWAWVLHAVDTGSGGTGGGGGDSSGGGSGGEAVILPPTPLLQLVFETSDSAAAGYVWRGDGVTNPTIDTTSIPAATVGRDFVFTLNSTPTSTWASIDLPPGASLAPNGTLTWRPSVPLSATIHVTATSFDGGVTTATFTLASAAPDSGGPPPDTSGAGTVVLALAARAAPGRTLPQFTADDFTAALQALLPRGRVWPRDPSSTQWQVLAGLSKVYERSSDRAAQLITDAFPTSTIELLAEWEATLGLPDPCAGELPTLAQRRAQVVTRLTQTGGQSAAYFQQLARDLGFDVTVENDAPFRVGQSSVGDHVGLEDWFFRWVVETALVTLQRFRAGQSVVGEPLQTWGNAVLECEIVERAPGQTVVQFKYT